MGAGERHANQGEQESTRSKASWPLAQGSCTLVRTQSCATRPSQAPTTPHHTRPHHIAHDTTPRIAGLRTAEARAEAAAKGCRLLTWFAAPPPHASRCCTILCRGHCFSVPPYRYTSFVLTGALGCGCRPMVWSSIRSQPSGRRQPSLTTHVPVLDCAHLLCVRAYTRPPYLH